MTSPLDHRSGQQDRPHKDSISGLARHLEAAREAGAGEKAASRPSSATPARWQALANLQEPATLAFRIDKWRQPED